MAKIPWELSFKINNNINEDFMFKRYLDIRLFDNLSLDQYQFIFEIKGYMGVVDIISQINDGVNELIKKVNDKEEK